MFGSAIAVGFYAIWTGLVVYGLLSEQRWRQRERAKRRAADRLIALAALRESYERPADQLEVLWDLPACVPDHEAIP